MIRGANNLSGRYILEGQIPVECPDLRTWGEWLERAKRHVGDTQVSDDVRVSTVFLGLDHNYCDKGAPILFETMIFGGPHDQYQERYCTWDEAEAGHAAAVKLAEEEVYK